MEVDVTRSGGVAGITRRWRAQPPEDEASEWIALIDRCPWDDAGAVRGDGDGTGRPVPDGFVWWIRVSWADADPREAELPEDAVTGAWRELIDAVRAWARATNPSERAGR